MMNIETLQWSTAEDLPQPMYWALATVCGDCVYMLGGKEQRSALKSVYACSVSALLQSCVLSSLEAKVERTSLVDKASVWRQIADLPVTRSTCDSFHGRLLAIQLVGEMTQGNPQQQFTCTIGPPTPGKSSVT